MSKYKRKKNWKKIKIYKCLIKCLKKNETLRQLHEFLNLGITNRFCFESSHFQRIPRFNANNCCIFRTLTVCQASVQNVWPRLSHSGSLPCEVHTATVLVFWRLGQAGTLSSHPTVTHSQQMPRGGLQPRGNHYADGNDIRAAGN